MPKHFLFGFFCINNSYYFYAKINKPQNEKQYFKNRIAVAMQ